MCVFRLNDIMKEKRITTQELADRTGIPKRTLDGYRASRKIPSLVNGIKIADALGINVKALYEDKE